MRPNSGRDPTSGDFGYKGVDFPAQEVTMAGEKNGFRENNFRDDPAAVPSPSSGDPAPPLPSQRVVTGRRYCRRLGTADSRPPAVC